MALAFEYYLNTDYSFKTSFQEQLAAYLSESYMEYINDQNICIKESDVGFDLDGDGKMNSSIALTIEYDLNAYPETNGYYGTYLDLYLAEFTQNLQWYVDSLDYADGWTWFDADGNAMSDNAVSAMTTEEKAQVFIEGRYTKSSSGDMKKMDDMPKQMDNSNKLPLGEMPERRNGQLPDEKLPDDNIVDLYNPPELYWCRRHRKSYMD